MKKSMFAPLLGLAASMAFLARTPVTPSYAAEHTEKQAEIKDPGTKAAPEKDAGSMDTKKADEKPAALASVYGLTKALSLFEEKSRGEWISNNAQQQEALDLEKNLAPEFPKVPKKIVDGIASGKTNELNEYLESHGYSIRIKQLAPGDLGVVMSTELDGKWPGKDKGELKYHDGKNYSSFELDKITAYKVEGHASPVLQIHHNTLTDVKLFVTPYAEELPGLEAASTAVKLTPVRAPQHKAIGVAILPKVDKNTSQTVSWLLGMKNKRGGEIRQALAQTTLQMNEKGFRAKEGIALVGSKEIEIKKAAYHIDRPFLLWAVKSGLTYPLFATRVDYDSFKDPGNFQ